MISFKESIDPSTQARRARDRISSRARDNNIVRFDRNKRADLNAWRKDAATPDRNRFRKIHMNDLKRDVNKIKGLVKKPEGEVETTTDTDPKPQFSKANKRLGAAAQRRTMDPGAKAKALADRAEYASVNRKRFGAVIRDGGSQSEAMTTAERAEKARTDSIAVNKKRFNSLLGT